MLVLLIVFMVAAPLATVDTPVDLPQSNAVQLERPISPVFLTIFADGGLAVGSAGVDRNSFAEAVDQATGGDPEARIFLRADKSVSYDQLMHTINLLRSAGYTRIALMGLDSSN